MVTITRRARSARQQQRVVARHALATRSSAPVASRYQAQLDALTLLRRS